MPSYRLLSTSFAALVLGPSVAGLAQSAGPLYTWAGSGNVQQWLKNFGTNSVTLSNTNPGELTIAETGTLGTNVAVSDDFNRVRESPAGSNGGLDLTGLSFLEFELGHNGSAPVNVQFFVQATPGASFLALGPDVLVQPGVASYQVPLTGLTAAQAVYVRTMGFNIRDHVAQGNLTWTVREVRSVGQTLTSRTLASFDNGTAEGGLQGAIINFDGGAVAGSDGGQDQVGLSHNAAGSGSLQWTDLGGSAGAAISLGNGTAWNGNTFNNRTTDASNYDTVTIRISATDAQGGGGSVNVQSFFQANNFANFLTAGTQPLPIDGAFHDLTFSLAGLANMNVVDQNGINLGAHPSDLVINVDSIVFNTVPEPAAANGVTMAAALGALRRRRRA
jgi:hypothetical protein